MSAIVVVQARTSSSRLPGKVLLPLGGVPLAVLAAKRAANRGHRVIVATSIESEDDELSSQIKANGIDLFRGSLTDVLGRFVEAIDDCAGDVPIVRLTADNAFPDGDLVADLERAFLAGSAEYLSCTSVKSGFPYGVSAEIMRADTLRRAAVNANVLADREHVTPWIKRNVSTGHFTPMPPFNMSQYRCTIDVLDDYLLVAKVFREVADPVNASLTELLRRLVAASEKPLVDHPVRKLVLGAAQLGMTYGVANVTGRPTDTQAGEIVATAIRNGVDKLDTARAYGASEAVIGKAIKKGWRDRVRILTKLEPRAPGFGNVAEEAIAMDVECQVLRSCRDLGTTYVDVVMVHRADHITTCNGAVWQSLKTVKNRGMVRALGVSVQNPQELRSSLEFDDLEHLQLPFNILDGRWASAIPTIISARAARNIEVHARSAFLQGLLISRSYEHWSLAGVDDPEVVWTWLDRLVRDFGREDTADLALAYVRAQDWIDGVVVGVETVDQLKENIRTFDRPVLTDEQCMELERSRPQLSPQTLNPARWQVIA